MPTIEASVDGLHDFFEYREVAIVGRQAPSQLPDPLYRGELGAVGRQEQQSQMLEVAPR